MQTAKKLAGARASKSIYLLPAYPRFKNNYTLQNEIILLFPRYPQWALLPSAFFVCFKNKEILYV